MALLPICRENCWPDACDVVLIKCYPFWEGAENEHALHYLQWTKDKNVEMFYFSSFDESWKLHHEGE